MQCFGAGVGGQLSDGGQLRTSAGAAASGGPRERPESAIPLAPQHLIQRKPPTATRGGAPGQCASLGGVLRPTTPALIPDGQLTPLPRSPPPISSAHSPLDGCCRG
eukprot:5696230-Pyramimonas_sp.AAC.1